VAKKTRKKQKHIPQRTCVGCHTVQPKRSMTRLVRSPDGVQIDLTGKLAGRGAYLHNVRACWEVGIERSLDRALKTKLSAEDRDRLITFMESLPKEFESTDNM
jgi:predicted RNA-binding protein YlxR (DUF448 family)